MNRHDILELARYTGLLLPPQNGVDWSAPLPTREYPHRLERFAALVAAAEREECAKVCEEDPVGDDPACCTNTAYRVASAIRKRGNK